MSETASLDELVSAVNDKIVVNKDPSKPYIGLEHLQGRGGTILGFAPASESISTNSVFQESDVLFGKLRPNLRKAALAPFDGYCSTDILVLRAREGVFPGFAGRVFQSELVGVAAERTAIGTKMPRTSWAHLKHEVVFAPSFNEQYKIAQILDTLDTQVRQTEALIAKLERIKQGLLTDLLTRGIDQSGQLRLTPDQALHLYKDSPLGWIPREWKIADGKTACQEIVVGIVIRPTQYYRSRGIPILRSANIRENRLSLEDLVYMSEQDHRSLSKSKVRPNDVLTVRTGYPGTSCVVDDSLDEANCVDIIISRPGPGLAPTYWCLWINSDFGKGHVLRSQGGLAQQHFNVSQLKGMIFPMPPRDEQELIAQAWQSQQRRIVGESLELDKLKVAKAGLMDDLLAGRVRVTLPPDSTKPNRAEN